MPDRCNFTHIPQTIHFLSCIHNTPHVAEVSHITTADSASSSSDGLVVCMPHSNIAAVAAVTAAAAASRNKDEAIFFFLLGTKNELENKLLQMNIKKER